MLYAIIKETKYKVVPSLVTPAYRYLGQNVDLEYVRENSTIEFVIDLPSDDEAESLTKELKNHSDNLVYFPPEQDYYELAYYSYQPVQQGIKQLSDFILY